MQDMKFVCVMTLSLVAMFAGSIAAQVQTEVPAVISGAKPVPVEHIKIHGTALEGNLEGDAVDRDVIVFLPPSYAKEKSPLSRWSMRCTAIPSARSNGRTRSTCRRPSKARSRRARRR